MMAEQEYPSQSYFCGAKIRLIVRFDEFANTSTVSGRAPKKILTKLKGIKDPRANVDVVPDPNAPSGSTRYLLKPTDGDKPGGPQKQDSSKDNLTHVIAGIIPSRLELGLNGIRTADTAKVEFNYIDLPIDPRCVRSCAIEIYLGTVSADDFIRGNNGETRTVSNGANGFITEPLNVIPDTYVDEKGRSRTNLRFQGWVDEWEVEFQDTGEPIVRFSCRDNTQLLIDTDAPPSLVLAVDQPIDKAIATYLSNFPTFAGLTVEYRGGTDIPVLKGQLSKTAYDPKTGGPSPAKGAGSGGKLSCWDYLTDIVGAIGHTIRVEGTNVIIQRVRTITGNQFPARSDDPYEGRTLTSGIDLPVRTFVYGRNILNLKLGRKYGKSVPKNIEVRSYSTKRKTTLVARFPAEHDPIVSKATPGDGGNEVAYQVIRISGVEDQKTLRIVAQSIYELIGRNEMTVSCRTKNLASFGGGNMDPDILDLRAGDSIDLRVNREESEFNSLNVIENLLLAQARAKEFLLSLGYSAEFSDAYAKAYSDAGFQTIFKVRAVGFTWELDQGVSIDITAANYIEVRADKALPAGEEPSTAGNTNTPQNQPRN